MKIYYLKIIVIIFLLIPLGCLSQTDSYQLMVCGDNQVIIFDPKQSQDTVPFVTWRWKASEAFDLPGIYRLTYLRSLDDCKPVDEGRKILVSSSSNGVALIDRATKETIFYANVGNAHSIEWLPGDRIVVAGSTNEKGNRLEVYDSKESETPLFQDSLYSAHGVVWDTNRKLLYALGYDVLRAYQLKEWDTDYPKLVQVHSWTIPGFSGHDLVAIPQQPDKLLLTEHESVWIFDKKTEKFSPFEPLEGREDVKAVSFHPESSQVAYIQAEISWWSHHVYLLDGNRYFSFPGVDLYKVRWIRE